MIATFPFERLVEHKRAVEGSPQKARFDAELAIAAVVVAACGLFVVAVTLHMVIVNWSPVPLGDQWEDLVTGRSITWSWLVKQHNEHRLFVPRLIFWLDRWLAAETNVIDFAVSILIQTALSVLLAWLSLRASTPDRITKLYAYGLSFTLLFWAVQYENFLWGYQVQFFGVGLLAAASFAMVAVGPPTAPGLATAVILAGAAVYTLGSGILVPVLAFILGMWAGKPRWYLLFLLIAAIVWPATYLWGYVTPKGHANPAEIVSQLDIVIFHFLVQLGGLFVSAFGGQQKLAVAAIFGGIGVSLFVATLIVPLLRPALPCQKALAMFAIYLLCAAFLTASVRASLGVSQAFASRYSTPAVSFWLSTILLWFSASRVGNRFSVMAIAASVPLAIVVSTSEPRFAQDGANYSLSRKLATPALLAGVGDPRLDDIVNVWAFLALRSVLLSQRTSVFAEEGTRLMGAPFSEHFAVDPKVHCSGVFLRAQMLDQGGSVWSATGTATLDGSAEELRRIIMVNGEDRIVGYGLGGFDPSAVGEEPDQTTSTEPVWWVGSLADADPSKVRAYAIHDENSACLIGSSPRIFQPAVTAPLPSPAPERGGYIEFATVDSNRVAIGGWGYLSSSEGQVMVDTDLPVHSLMVYRKLRPDVVAALHDRSLQNAGVYIRVALQSGANRDRYRLCIWTYDPRYGRRTLYDPTPKEGQPIFTCDATGASPVNVEKAEERAGPGNGK